MRMLDTWTRRYCNHAYIVSKLNGNPKAVSKYFSLSI